MQYNYNFEIASLLFMFMIFVHFAVVQQMTSEKTRVYRILLFVCLGECVFNLLSAIGLANADVVPQVVNEIFAFAFFAFEGLASLLIYRYIIVLCDFDERRKKIAFGIGAAFTAVCGVLLILTPFIGFFYFFENNRYHQGFGSTLGYIYAGIFFLLNLFVILIRRKQVSAREKVIISLYTLVALLSIAVQYYHREILLTSLANAIVIAMLYFSMQNPSEMQDFVTRIGNEAALELQLLDEINRNKNGTLIFVYIKQFHQMNLLFGTENCNRLLAEMGRFFYRLGGKTHVFRSDVNTFAIMAGEKDYRDKIQAVKSRFSEEWKIGENHIIADDAIGVLHYPKDFTTIPQFLGIRDYMLSDVVKNARKEVLESDRGIIEGYYRQKKIEIALDNAIRKQAIQVCYQPIYSLREKRIIALEALARLKDEKLGIIPPEEFIPIAEKNGDIIRIGEIVLEECCKFLSRHVLSNMSLGIEAIQVNISVAQCMQQNLKETILPILQKYHIPPSMIILELTESTAIQVPALMEHHIKELGEAGISFALDDYGTGNANCSYLVQFPFREIKIDKEMTKAYFSNKTARIVLENEIKTIHKLGIPMVVEGIEKLEQSHEMERLGVEYIQGFFYGKPLPEMDCLRYIRNFNSVPEDYGRQRLDS